MVKIKKVKDEAAEVRNRLEKEELKPAQRSRLKKRLQFLQICVRYLESTPNEYFINKQLEDVELKITRRMKLFVLEDEEKLAKKEVSKMRKEHEKKYEVPHLRDQARALRYLLS
jgi:hypothetical protein